MELSANYPFDQTLWNVNDQNYYCTMVNKYRYPVDRVQELFRFLIKEGRCSTFEAEYQDYLASQTQA